MKWKAKKFAESTGDRVRQRSDVMTARYFVVVDTDCTAVKGEPWQGSISPIRDLLQPGVYFILRRNISELWRHRILRGKVCRMASAEFGLAKIVPNIADGCFAIVPCQMDHRYGRKIDTELVGETDLIIHYDRAVQLLGDAVVWPGISHEVNQFAMKFDVRM